LNFGLSTDFGIQLWLWLWLSEKAQQKSVRKRSHPLLLS